MDCIDSDSWFLVTGAGGFIGGYVVRALVELGVRNVRCMVRPCSDVVAIETIAEGHAGSRVEVVTGNLLSTEDCKRAARNVSVVIHLATGRGKSFPSCYANSVVATRNLLEALVKAGSVKRFVNVSTFAVHSGAALPWGGVLDETCPIEDELVERYDAYVYAKVAQERLVDDYHRRHRLPFVTVRPTVVIGPERQEIPAHVGLGTFGFFLHIGRSNLLPLSYVENCADAIVLAAIKEGVEGEAFLIVDDELPTCREFLHRYRKHRQRFAYLTIPYPMFYLFCWAWERYAHLSGHQVPPVFNRRMCAFYWKKRRYSNRKSKELLGWRPRIPMGIALERCFSV